MILTFMVVSILGEAQVLKVGVVGLSHDHAYGLMNQYKNGEVSIVGIVETDKKLIDRYKTRYQLSDALFFNTTEDMLAKLKPDAVLAYNAIADHLAVVEACAPKGISVMVEKPLAVNNQQAERIAALSKRYNIHVLTNYETTWYPSNQQVKVMVHEQGAVGSIRKMVVHDGHQGPKEIGCSEEFLSWLTDPVKNGGGALIDFGCYGANLMTWLMKGKAPVAVTALTRRIKPDIYPKVDDDATILVEYEDATGIIEASWNWPFGIKDLEVFGTTGYLHAQNSKTIRERKKDEYVITEAKTPVYTSNLKYLSDVLQGKTQPGTDLSSLENNLIVVKILDAARRSAAEGKRIVLK
ncbi:MAG TPA: Gfo/Idh/MocA family oxidoreductase [Chryseolinea sp.]